MKRHHLYELGVAMLVLLMGVGIVAALTSGDTTKADDNLVTTGATETTTDPAALDAYAAAVHGFELQQFVDAVTAAQIVAYSQAVEAARAAAAAKPVPAKPAAPAAKPSAPRSSGGGYGTPSAAYMACIGMRESGNNYASVGGGRWGIIDSTWRAMGGPEQYGVAHSWLASPSAQDAMMYAIYAASGPRAWSPYDHC